MQNFELERKLLSIEIQSPLVYFNMSINIKFQSNPSLSFCFSAATNFLTYTDRHFLKKSKACSGHPEMSKSVKNWKLENFHDSNTCLLCRNQKKVQGKFSCSVLSHVYSTVFYRTQSTAHDKWKTSSSESSNYTVLQKLNW